MAASSAAGWRSSSASWGSSSAGISAPPSGANADLKVHKGRIPGFRRARNRNGLWSIRPGRTASDRLRGGRPASPARQLVCGLEFRAMR